MFHDPLTFAPNSDYDEFMNSHIWRIEEYFARVVKEELAKEIVALTWHMGGGWRGDFRAFINSLKRDGNTLVWLYAPGSGTCFAKLPHG